MNGNGGNMLQRLYNLICYVGIHFYTRKGSKRFCPNCGRKEVLCCAGWIKHTYLGDAHYDDTPIMTERGESTIAIETRLQDYKAL